MLLKDTEIYYQQMPNVVQILGVIVFGIVLTIIGYTIFNKLQKRFAEEL